MHSTTHLEQDLGAITDRIFTMFDLAIEFVEDSISILHAVDSQGAEKLIERDRGIDKAEMTIDHQCLTFIATRQPAGTDLRLIRSYLKMDTDLERIGDLAKNICKETKILEGQSLVKPLIDIPRMAETVVEMLRECKEAIITKDSEKAQRIIQRDEVIDNLNEQQYRVLTTIMGEDPSTVNQSIALINIAKSIERMGDHVTNIAEQIIFFIEGDDIRHTIQK